MSPFDPKIIRKLPPALQLKVWADQWAKKKGFSGKIWLSLTVSPWLTVHHPLLIPSIGGSIIITAFIFVFILYLPDLGTKTQVAISLGIGGAVAWPWMHYNCEFVDYAADRIREQLVDK
jgi:UDP-N-acetylmuramyl pentapeptide phosphotransferase/UDP-N-acetylglucosamine-1-phosphate transferase